MQRELNMEGTKLESQNIWDVCLYADASSIGYGGYVEIYQSNLVEGSPEGCPEIIFERLVGPGSGHGEAPGGEQIRTYESG